MHIDNVEDIKRGEEEMYMNETGKKERIVGLDIYRILAVLFVFLFHSNMHIRCEYGVLTPFIRMGAIYMTAFFILSGFSLYLTWKSLDLHNIKHIKRFYIKRLIGILPLYYSSAILYILFLGKETAYQNLLLVPIEILGIQSNFNSLFSLSHNSGTWFVSCLLMCYLIYPLLQEIIKQISIKKRIIMLVVLCLILLYSPIIVLSFQTSTIYSSPFFRIIEFCIGVVLCSFMQGHTKKNKNILFSWGTIAIEYIILIVGVTIGVKSDFYINDYMLYGWIALPVFMLQIVSFFGVHFPKRMHESKCITYLCKISYAFFFAQFFAWKTTLYVVDKIGTESNKARIILSFSICIVYAIILHEVFEKSIVKIAKKIMKLQ